MAALSGRLAASALMADLGSTAIVPHDGYRWWYVDALSADGRHGITIIAFIGSVFSPFYAWSRRKRPADPGAALQRSTSRCMAGRSAGR